MNNTLVRTLTAAVLLAIVAAVYFIGGQTGFLYLCYLVIILVQREIAGLLFYSHSQLFKSICTLFSALTTILIVSVQDQVILFATLFLIFQISLCLFVFCNKGVRESRELFANITLNFFYAGCLPATIIQLLFLNLGLQWLVSCLLVVFAGDVFAYFVGTRFGSIKLLPLLSPKKSLQGSLGGLFGSALFGYLSCLLFFPQQNPAVFVAVGLIAGIFAQTGDFFESGLKRTANIKDSSHILPGHGGFLDRFDGVLFAAPIFYLFALFSAI